MAHPQAIEVLVRRVAREVRVRRAEHWSLRGAFWGGLAAVVVLSFKAGLGTTALVVAPALVALGVVAGATYGLTKRVDPHDIARLADRAFDLADRVATALEWADHPDRTPLVDALVADTVERVSALESRQIVRRAIPVEGRWLGVPLLAGLVLALAPAIRLPMGALVDFTPSTETEPHEERTTTDPMEERSRPLSATPLKRPSFEERDFAQRSGTGSGATAGDLSAIFKDTALSSQRPDFNSFLKKGDERLKLLEQVDRLPDLQSDFTSSQYKMVFKKSKSLLSGLSPDISPQKLRELLDEMERLGRKGGNWSGDASEGMEALEGGQTDRALEAMQRALDKMRAMEESQRSGKGLRGGRESERGARGRDRARGGGEGSNGPEDQDFGEGEGFLPGKGRSTMPKGDPTARLRASPFDVGVEGESRRGRKEGYDTNLTGRAGQMPSRLMYLGVIGQYRKMMEDAITREQVPRDYHDQVRNYFQALDER
ncbi:MAG: hypothetical protein AUH77_01660 [Candidatus Rokubacteria bacterium 13_1_40CM_4_69_39]|nr:MAG: hypothetical protein AUH09_06100 [Candidatus Rokubacteria bacterium 13_2_20CM_70_12]OLC59399.1 MAG: hypothetical protein AUH77_01660 [Candidatus Rokubacteria bacterium 13_1_40CM_4_69_39]OLC98705.1 MAG: hypothetical protein AUJ05_00220 [Candidatus Rokubacteria bacterium 13_1_40CM_3_69_38]OLE50387.1 MAG: hypothetical protein AUG01_01210 [Candidatus Rokubacteria bacterium 13_1_20CM_2_69_58]PYM48091.1 MAG: hypothetical protein DME14_12505 [Candidatus Rokubacteria bacterium]